MTHKDQSATYSILECSKCGGRVYVSSSSKSMMRSSSNTQRIKKIPSCPRCKRQSKCRSPSYTTGLSLSRPRLKLGGTGA